MKTVIASVLAVLALSGCVAVPYPAGPGVYVAPPPAAVYYGGPVYRHHHHGHYYRHYR
jgi:hypothetical protein